MKTGRRLFWFGYGPDEHETGYGKKSHSEMPIAEILNSILNDNYHKVISLDPL